MTNPKLCKTLPVVGPNEEIEFELFPLFKSDVLYITEATKATSEIVLKYRQEKGTFSSSQNQTIRIFDRNSITWEDDRRAAAFVTARDPAILEFSKQVTGAVKGIAPRPVDEHLVKAMSILEALYLFGINYEIDPNSSYIELHEQRVALDFLQFPRQTLQYGAGDCDDLSILYSALLKAVGVETAFITIPGHIYAAFSLAMPPGEAQKNMAGAADLIYQKQKAWVPIEITILDQGFLEAWRRGAQQWRENETSAMLIEVDAAQRLYEPVGLPGESGAIELPAPADIKNAFAEQLSVYINREIHSKEALLMEKLEENPDDVRIINRLGLLYAQYSLYDRAESAFLDVLAVRKYIPAMLNLGNLYFLRGDTEIALEYYEEVYGENPEKVGILLPMARAYYLLEDYDSAGKFFAILEEKVPEYASKYSYLGSAEPGQARADQAKSLLDLIEWTEE